MEHRATTVCLHFPQSLACLLAVSHVRPILFNSSMALRLHVCLGRPGFLFPCGFQSKDWRVTFEGSFLSACPTHFHFLCLIWIDMGSWLALFHSSVFGTLSCHFNWRIWRRHLLMKVWILFELPVVTLHVSELYIRTNLTLELKTLSLVCVEMT